MISCRGMSGGCRMGRMPGAAWRLGGLRAKPSNSRLVGLLQMDKVGAGFAALALLCQGTVVRLRRGSQRLPALRLTSLEAGESVWAGGRKLEASGMTVPS